MPIRKTARRVHRLLSRPTKPHQPDFDEQGLIAVMRRHLGTKSIEPARQTTNLPTEQHPPSLQDVAEYFRQRSSPAFFADADTITQLARNMSVERPEWRTRLMQSVTSDQTQGLPIYSTVGAALQPGYPWSELPEGSNNDDLYVVRPHRFGFAPRNALAILYGHGSAAKLADLLEGWMAFVDDNGGALPYTSALVVIQRVLALSWTHAFAAASSASNESDNIRLQCNILRILYADITFLIPRLGRSYPNNHLLADRFAAWYIRLLFPEFMPGAAELDHHESLWLAELDRQVYPDGTGFEHSLHYHEFGCEMAAAYVLLAQRNSRPIPSGSLSRIARMLEFQAHLAGSAGITLPFGNATEDPLFPLDTGSGWATAALRELHRAMFNPQSSASSPNDPSMERAFWLLGGNLAPPHNDSTDSDNHSRSWTDGGFFLFPDDGRSASLVLRTGPSEHRDLIAGHMHADLLSICVNHAGKPVLVDPGTQTYRFHADSVTPGRAYFAGPEAHNGLFLDGIDPLGALRGDFRGKDVPVRTSIRHCVLGNQLSWVEAEIRGHTLYAGYRRGVVHVKGAYWVIYDQLPSNADNHTATLGFQTAPTVKTYADTNKTAWLSQDNASLWLSNSSGLEGPELSYGQLNPIGGWVAPRYGTAQPATQLRYKIADGLRFTAFALGVDTKAMHPVEVTSLDAGIAIRLEGTKARDLLLLATHDDPIQVNSATDQAHAEILWSRHAEGESRLVRCLGKSETECRSSKDLSILFMGEQWK